MKLTLRLIGILALVLALVAAPAHASGGFFFFGADLGYVEHVGFVPQGTRIAVQIAAVRADDDLLTCPLKATFLIVQRNNATNLHRKTIRRNAGVSQVTLDSARFDGEAILIIQTQSRSHSCVGQADVIVEVAGTVTSQDTRGQRDIGPVASDVPSDESVPVDLSSPDVLNLIAQLRR